MALPNVPDEIWEEVFEQATYVPHALDTIVDPFEESEASSSISLCIQRTYGTKKALALVCRQFNRIAMPLLFRFVVISSRTSRQNLKKTLRDGRPSTLALFTSTLRLDFPSCFGTHGDVCGEMFILEWLRTLTSLRIFVHSFEFEVVASGHIWEPSFSNFSQLFSYLPQSVRTVDIAYDEGLSNVILMTDRRLDALHVRPQYRPGHLTRRVTQAHATFYIEEVQSLEIPANFLSAMVMDPPSGLTHLTLTEDIRSHRRVEELQCIGHQLLHLEIPDISDLGTAVSPSPLNPVLTLGEAFPRLKSFILTLPDRAVRSDFSVLRTPPPNIEKLGLRIGFQTERSYHLFSWSHFFATVAHVQSHVPTLSSLHLLIYPSQVEERIRRRISPLEFVCNGAYQSLGLTGVQVSGGSGTLFMSALSPVNE